MLLEEGPGGRGGGGARRLKRYRQGGAREVTVGVG